MPRGMHDRQRYVANLELLPVCEFTVRRRRLFELHAVNLRLPTRCLVESSVERVEVDWHIPALLDRRNRPNVIDVGVRDPDGLERRAGFIDCVNEALPLAAGIYDDRLSGARVHYQVTVLLERADGERLDGHHYFFALLRIC